MIATVPISMTDSRLRGGRRSAPTRVLILTASVGEGHDHPTSMLAAQLRAERPDVEVVIEDCLAVMGRPVALVSESAPRVIFFRLAWLWDLAFWLFARLGPVRRLSQRALTEVGGPGLLRLVAARAPDVVVSTYPQSTEVLGRLRRQGRLSVPLCAAVTDLAALDYWVSPGADVHLVTHPESLEEVHSIAGADARVHVVQGFSDPAFLQPRDQHQARAALALPREGNVVLVSGGGWGVGRLSGAIQTALRVPGVSMVVGLCGRNDDLRRDLGRQFVSDARVRLEGFTEAMPDWLAAADALVHSTAGLTVLEALIRGCPVISFGWGRGHIRPNNAAFRRLGLADVADSEEQLTEALERALARRRALDLDYARRPSAASFVLAEAGDGTRGGEGDGRDGHE